MSRPELFTELSEPQREALRRAHARGIPVDAPRSVGVQRVTAESLERQGLLAQRQTRKGRLEWRCSDRGRGLLVAHEPRFLHRHSSHGYTSDPRFALFAEPEACDDQTLAGFRRDAQTREHERYEQRLQALKQRSLQERLALAQRLADRLGINIRRDLFVIGQRLTAIETQLLKPVDRTASAEPGDPGTRTS